MRKQRQHEKSYDWLQLTMQLTVLELRGWPSLADLSWLAYAFHSGA